MDELIKKTKQIITTAISCNWELGLLYKYYERFLNAYFRIKLNSGLYQNITGQKFKQGMQVMPHPFLIPDAHIMSDTISAWRGQSMLVVGNDGELHGSGISGYYFRGVRYLTKFGFRINGHNLHLCSSGKGDFNRLEFFYIYPPVESGGTGGSGSGMMKKREGIFERGLDIRLQFMVRPSGMDIEFQLTNRWDKYVEFELGTLVKSDFLSLDEAHKGEKGGFQCSKILRINNGFACTCNILQLPLKMELNIADAALWSYSEETITRKLSVNQGETIKINLHLRAIDPSFPFSNQAWQEREGKMTTWSESLARLHADPPDQYSSIVNGLMDYLCSAALLEGESDEWLTPAAGYPLYPFLFGRDALTSGWMMAMFDGGQSINHSLTRLGRLQGKVVDDYRDEQPGRIIQQARNDISSRTGHNPFDRYYGDYASPLMFIISLAHLYAWSGDIIHVKKHWDSCKRILGWVHKFADLDGDGFLEYKTRSPFGPRHQGWKDSQNAVVDENGALVDPPIATCELQGYYYAALQAAAFFSTLNHSFGDAVSYAKKAVQLKKRFNDLFWVDDGGYIAFGLDSKKRQIRSRASNMGHCLASGIIDNSRIGKVVSTFFAADMFSGWGIRTLSSTNPSFNPLSYHLGSVWPVENATIALGLRRYGFDNEALRLVEANYDLARLWRNGYIPECIGGYDRDAVGHPGAFPRANALQTWNAAAFGLFTHVMFGLQPVAPLRTLFIDPILPRWLPSLTIKNLRLGGARVSLQCKRKKDGKTHTRVFDKKGKLHVLHQPLVNAFNTSFIKRGFSLVYGTITGLTF